jgi:hypothetical protein
VRRAIVASIVLLPLGALAAILLGVGYAAIRLVGARLAAEAYRARLEAVIEDYERLRGEYGRLARRTAITELMVRDGHLSVSVRGAAGVLETVETPLDPSKEIFVDFLVIDGRLWIRRVFDETTPPGEGVWIDPRLAKVDWSEDGARYGKIAYRPLGEGRWVVTVTGDGSLGLERGASDAPAPLELPPPLLAPEPLEPAIDAARASLTPIDLLRALVSSVRAP